MQIKFSKPKFTRDLITQLKSASINCSNNKMLKIIKQNCYLMKMTRLLKSHQAETKTQVTTNKMTILQKFMMRSRNQLMRMKNQMYLRKSKLTMDFLESFTISEMLTILKEQIKLIWESLLVQDPKLRPALTSLAISFRFNKNIFKNMSVWKRN